MRFFLLTAALLGVAGCERKGIRLLPDQLLAVARLERGGYVSLMVSLPRPGEQPTIRMTPGIVAAGPGWASAVHISELGPETSRQIEYRRLTGEPLVSMPLLGTPSIMSIDKDGLHVGVGEHRWWLDAVRGVVEPATEAAWPGGRQNWRGPREGFSIRLTDEQIELHLPRSQGVGIPLLYGVEAVLGSWWLTNDEIPAWQGEHLNAIFKEVGGLAVEPGSAVADGDMREWRGDRALAVDSRSQIITGEDYWSGPRDGSFGIASRVAEGTTWLAIRIRDDDLQRGSDRLELMLGERSIEITIPLQDEHTVVGSGWSAHFTEERMQGVGLEVHLETPGLTEARVLPLVVRYIDHDSEQGSTTLGTSAWPALVGLGHARLEHSAE
ncbi:MAG: hypothetical protein P8R54_15465 [Myxococcota bacterium]|nr:hypothetical protein [Myxococcota bacterium]